MAGNEWINSYLEAILDAGVGIECRSPPVVHDSVYFNSTKYFIEEVVTAYDEGDLYRTWMKVVAMRNAQERNTRMENLCWRIWHLTRRKKHIELEDRQQMTCGQIEKEEGPGDDTKKWLEDLSEEDKTDSDSAVQMCRNYSDREIPYGRPQTKKCLYIVLISLHGLVRGENMELGRDSDTGGQVKYVVELARALVSMPEVYRVDLLTRQVASLEVDWSYGEPTEMLAHASPDCSISDNGESSGAYIVRIPCGPRDEYIRKELLWPHIQEFVDGCLTHVLNMAKVLGEQINEGEHFVWPHVIHGHYADAGDIASLLSGALNVPMVLTGHSLGRNKMDQLLKQGRQSKEDINSTYKVMRRIEGEELSLDAAELVITSTQQEIQEQWELYDGFDVKLEKVLRLRSKRGMSCHGRYMPRMVVIPPGMDFSKVIASDAGEAGEGELESAFPGGDPTSPQAEPSIWSEIRRFFNNPHKPIILALARPDPKKNIATLVKAFGECKPLRDLANLTLIMGNRDDIDEMSGGNALVLTAVLKLVDKYDLYGQVAYPKHHKQSDVPDIYRLAVRTKGVFINPALVEPFGLTLIEAAAHGLPIVATKNGGPVDIHRALNNGLLVDPHDHKCISDALLRLVSDRRLWGECRINGLKNIHLFSWPQHCHTYLARIALCRMRHPQWQDEISGQMDDESQGESLRDIRDISLQLSIDDKILANGLLENVKTQKSVQNGDKHSANAAFHFMHEVEKMRKETPPEDHYFSEETSTEKSSSSISNMVTKVSVLQRKQKIIVIAVDSYNPCGRPGVDFVQIIREIMRSVRHELFPRPPGFILSTSLSLFETVDMLRSGGLQKNFDALICSSGSELYHSASHAQEACSTVQSQFFADPDYTTHIEYRWGQEGLRKTMARVLNIDREKTGCRGDCAFVEDLKTSNSHCLAYKIKDSPEVPNVEELRKKLRIRGLRCHVIYCKQGSQLHVVPLLASRAQALRYLFVRWGIDLRNMFVFVGETGDTDYEQLLSGIHKTIILKDAVEGGCNRLLRGNYSYHKEDVVAPEGSNIVTTENGFNYEAIQGAFKKLA